MWWRDAPRLCSAFCTCLLPDFATLMTDVLRMIVVPTHGHLLLWLLLVGWCWSEVAALNVSDLFGASGRIWKYTCPNNKCGGRSIVLNITSNVTGTLSRSFRFILSSNDRGGSPCARTVSSADVCVFWCENICSLVCTCI
jgi:hypothetical protein